MMDKINEVSDKRVQALKEIEKNKLRVARAYNKKVKGKFLWSVSWFGRQFCLLGLKVISLADERQVGRVPIKISVLSSRIHT